MKASPSARVPPHHHQLSIENGTAYIVLGTFACKPRFDSGLSQGQNLGLTTVYVLGTAVVDASQLQTRMAYEGVSVGSRTSPYPSE